MKFLIMQTNDALDLELPEYKSKSAAGVDLPANVCGDVVVMPGEFTLVGTGVKIALPEGFEAQIRPRSGLALRHGISLLNTPGTIDADYRGEIKVVLVNFGKEPFVVKRGMRIAQMIVSKVEHVEWVRTDALPDSERGEGGFGHTGR